MEDVSERAHALSSCLALWLKKHTFLWAWSQTIFIKRTASALEEEHAVHCGSWFTEIHVVWGDGQYQWEYLKANKSNQAIFNADLPLSTKETPRPLPSPSVLRKWLTSLQLKQNCCLNDLRHSLDFRNYRVIGEGETVQEKQHVIQLLLSCGNMCSVDMGRRSNVPAAIWSPTETAHAVLERWTFLLGTFHLECPLGPFHIAWTCFSKSPTADWGVFLGLIICNTCVTR